jgi:ubiquinone/menaquinone biosynthesis C-methylase UbiE
MKNRSCNNDEINKGLRSVLSNPVIYHFFGKIIGLHDKYRMYVKNFIKPFPGMKILDIGCGTAAILRYLPSTIEYTGYDINSDYINYAQKKFGQRAKFYNKRVNDMSMSDSDLFDVVIADGLVHHLNDDEAIDLFHIGYNALKDGGFMLTIDPTFVHKQLFIDRFLTSIDRGQHVRKPNEYIKIAESIYSRTELYIINDVSRIPLTGCILKCWKD